MGWQVGSGLQVGMDCHWAKILANIGYPDPISRPSSQIGLRFHECRFNYILFIFSLFVIRVGRLGCCFLRIHIIKEVMNEVDYEDERLNVCRTNTFVSMNV